MSPQVALRSWQELASAISAAARGFEDPSNVLRILSDSLGFDGAMLTSPDPSVPGGHRIVCSRGYRSETAEYLVRTYVSRCPGFKFAREQGVPARMCDTPFDFRETRTYQEFLGPDGFREGVTVTFSAAGPGRTGMLAMNSGSARPLTPEGCMALTLLAPELAAIGEAPFAGLVSDIQVDDLVIEFDAFGSMRWIRSGQERRLPIAEEALREFARRLRISKRHQAGFFEKDTDGAWWRVRAFRRQSPLGETTVIVLLSRQGPRGGITERELDILGLVGRGLTNNEIADVLGISLRTVKTHLEAVFLKLDQTNRAELVGIAIDEDLCSRNFIIRN
jgi:DNA-binding CsgD family transcriptional regulator